MKAIHTKYFGPTNYHGSRIRAKDGAKHSITIPYPHELSGEEVYRKAAEALRDKMGWEGYLTGGWLQEGEYVFVFGGCPSCH